MRLYSQMTLAELQIEMERLREEAAARKKAGDMVQFGILQQKFFMAKSYFVGTKEFRIGGTYRVYEHDQPFTIDYFKGVFAWGRFSGSDVQEGLPVGMLE